MWQPKYSLSPRLLNNITTIERLYGQIEGVQLPQQLELNLKRDNLIKSSYASNKIEGNDLSLPEVTNLLLDDRVPVNRDEKEVMNYFDVLGELGDYIDREMTVALIEELHMKLFGELEDEAGRIRNEQVVVGKYTRGLDTEDEEAFFRIKHNPPFHTRDEITKAMDELMRWVDQADNLPAVIHAGGFHHQFLYLHPFEDGNGRVCRVLTALLFMRRGYEINKYFVLDDYYDIDRLEYSDKLHSADEGEMTEWLEYFSKGVMYSLQSALIKVQNLVKTVPMKNRPSKKEAEVLELMQTRPEITSTEVADIMEVSRQQAFNLLRNLVDKGFLEKEGTTKASYYSLKKSEFISHDG